MVLPFTNGCVCEKPDQTKANQMMSKAARTRVSQSVCSSLMVRQLSGWWWFEWMWWLMKSWTSGWPWRDELRSSAGRREWGGVLVIEKVLQISVDPSKLHWTGLDWCANDDNDTTYSSGEVTLAMSGVYYVLGCGSWQRNVLGRTIEKYLLRNKFLIAPFNYNCNLLCSLVGDLSD